MTTKKRYLGWLGAMIFILAACAPSPPPPAQQLAPDNQIAAKSAPAGKPLQQAAVNTAAHESMQLPVRFQRPNFLINEHDGAQVLGQDEEIVIQVGADISSTNGSVPLRDIMKRLAALKNMNISWASDVDQFAPVDVDIRAEDDFFRAIDNLLRQVDYFHEVEGNTIIVSYKETKRFHLAMPFLTSTYSTGVGGDVLGSAGGDANIVGNLQLTSQDNSFDIWENIRTNLDQILEIWSEPAPSSQGLAATPDEETASDNQSEQAIGSAPVRMVRDGKGYYSIDKPIGLITVTAPRLLLQKVESYLENLKEQLYRQVSIEAKILEVTLEDTSTKGIDWTDVISNVQLDFQMFGPNGIIYSPTESSRVLSQVSTSSNPFTLILDAIEQQGNTKVLANPKLSVMNGQPAIITVGENVRFIDKIESEEGEGGAISFTVSTASIMSGLGLSVVATIMDNDEVILSLTPVTSQLEEPIQSVNIGQGSIMLPKVSLREMNTMVRIQNGGMLVVGGLIDESEGTRDTKVPILGDLPVVNKLFKSETKSDSKTELVILLRPQII